jgi:glucose/arabinose dehydrogenase
MYAKHLGIARRLFFAPLLLVGVLSSPLSVTSAAAEGHADGRFASDELLVEQVYQDVFGRAADRAGLEYWTTQLQRGASPAEVYNQFVGSGEFGGSVAPVARLYFSVLGRGPDAAGLRFWSQRLRDGASLEQVSGAFLDGAEFGALTSASSDTEIVEAVFGRVLGRTPDRAGLDYWTREIAAGRLTVPGFVAAVSESPEHQNRRNPEVVVTTIYLGLLQRAPEPGGLAYWADLVRAGASPVQLIDPILNGIEYRNRFAPPPDPTVSEVASGLTIPWGVAPLNDGRLLLTERAGTLSIISTSGARTVIAADLSDLFASGETGLMGIVADPSFDSNGRFYTCQGHSSPREIQVIAWTLAGTSATRTNDPLVGGLPISSGRHGGCQLEIDQEGALIVGTGDSAVGSVPQDLGSLGGKTLRVNRSTGLGWPTNPFNASANPDTARILSFGHRNVQGVAVHPGTGDIWTVEHGPSRDDEVNRIVAGGNYGWNPVTGYNESVPMTDLSEFPNAITAAWSTGAPTLALSDGAFLTSNSWGSWRNGLAVTSLKDRSLRVLFFTDDGAYRGQHIVLRGDYGRLRAVAEGPDGALLVTTSNGGGQDKLLRIDP